MLSRLARNARPVYNSARLASYKFDVKGKDLPVRDISSSDPYFTLMLENGQQVYKSEVIKQNLNPTFKTFALEDSVVGGEGKDLVRVEVKDKDLFNEDDHMGIGFFKISDLKNGPKIVFLSDEETHQSCGQLEVVMYESA